MTTSELGPFSLANIDLQKLVHHPDSDLFKKIIISSTERDRKSIVRLWLTEGIPYAFRDNAGTYEEMREWLSLKLEINAKDITIVGSGRIGFSMKPAVFGRSYDGFSDLDLTIINEKLFNHCQIDAEKFSKDLFSGKIVPNNENKSKFWNDNTARLPNMIKNGYIDTSNFIGGQDYPNILKVKDTMWKLREKLDRTANVFNSKKISVRVYRDWDSLVGRVSYNLNSARAEFKKQTDF